MAFRRGRCTSRSLIKIFLVVLGFLALLDLGILVAFPDGGNPSAVRWLGNKVNLQQPHADKLDHKPHVSHNVSSDVPLSEQGSLEAMTSTLPATAISSAKAASTFAANPKAPVASALMKGICASHFFDLYELNPDWGIEYYGAENSEEAKKKVNNSIHHIRAYMNCFLEKEIHTDIGLNITELETRLFPAFTNKLPIFTRWDGIQIDNGFPDLDKTRELAINTNTTHELIVTNSTRLGNANASFWNNLKHTMNGKGIIISMSEKGVEEMKRLLQVLRVLGNELPIQIMYKGDITEPSINELIHFARDPLYMPNLQNETHSSDTRAKAMGVPPIVEGSPQELWFVNVARCIAEPSWYHFTQFNNKWLAMLFTSFDETIIMDTDAVPFVSIEEFFTAPEYVESQAYFFKDRPISDWFLNDDDKRFLRGLLPSDRECDLFQKPRLTNFTYDNALFGSGYSSLMESGIVAMKRSTHLSGLLMSTTLQLWSPSSQPLYGDKEIFWLGQAAVGSEQYRFNSNTAAALGKLIEGDHAFEKETPSSSVAPPLSTVPVDIPPTSTTSTAAEAIEAAHAEALPTETVQTSVFSENRKLEEAVKGGNQHPETQHVEIQNAENGQPSKQGHQHAEDKQNEIRITKRMTDHYIYNHTCSAQPAHLDRNYRLMWTNGGVRNCKLENDGKEDWDGFEEVRKDHGTFGQYQDWLVSPLDIDGAMIASYVERNDMNSYFGLSGFRQAKFKGCAGYIWCAYNSEAYPAHWVSFDEEEVKRVNHIKHAWNTILV